MVSDVGVLSPQKFHFLHPAFFYGLSADLTKNVAIFIVCVLFAETNCKRRCPPVRYSRANLRHAGRPLETAGDLRMKQALACNNFHVIHVDFKRGYYYSRNKIPSNNMKD